MGPFTEATYDELDRLLNLVETGRRLDYDWFLYWMEGDPRTITSMSTSDVLFNLERDIET
jgi:hypothetical protein